MAEERSANEKPLYSRLLKHEYLLLIVGTLMLLSALGEVKIPGWIEFRPSHDISPIARSLLALAGLVLLFASVTLFLLRAHIWQSRLALIYFFSSVILVAVFGFFILIGGPVTVIVERRAIVRSWGFKKSGPFRVEVFMARLKDRREKFKILIICRLQDPSIQFDYDSKIQKSNLFDISEAVTPLMVRFSPEFSAPLIPDKDIVECAICTLPREISRDLVQRLYDVKMHGGEVHNFVAVTVR